MSDDPERVFSERAKKVMAIYEAHGTDGLKQVAFNDLGVLGLATTAEIDRVEANLARSKPTDATKLTLEELRVRSKAITNEMLSRPIAKAVLRDRER
jgi:hypothetical protein